MVGLGDGRYERRKVLGNGGMGEIWEAEDRLMGRTVAVKLLRAQHLGDEQMQSRFLREWQATARLAHENVVRAYDCGWDESEGRRVMYLVMELLDGMSLRDRMDLEKDRRLPVALVIRWARQICRALEAAHAEGLVHRDLKPANIQITSQDRAVLLDFGIACFQENDDGHTRITPTGWIVGTPEYMSPEQIAGRRVTSSSDLYSLGCLLYAMLTGRPPFQRHDGDLRTQHLHALALEPGARCGDSRIPKALDDLVMDLLEKDPRDRPSNAAEVRKRLDAVGKRLDAAGRKQAPRSHEMRAEAPLAGQWSQKSGPVHTSSSAAVGRPGREQWRELVGACLVVGTGAFGLLYGVGGADVGSSALWAVVTTAAPLFGGLLANSGWASGFSDEDAAGCLVLAVLVTLVVGCVWLMAASAHFPWHYDLFIGMGLALGVIGLAAFTHVLGEETGYSDGAGVMALLNAALLGLLSAVLFASQLSFVWWTTVLSALGVWLSALILTMVAYRYARS